MNLSDRRQTRAYSKFENRRLGKDLPLNWYTRDAITGANCPSKNLLSDLRKMATSHDIQDISPIDAISLQFNLDRSI